MNISHKLCVLSLQQECLTFLVTHAAGRPIKAMRIAELFEEEELYREASRFVLDNPGGWSEHELNTLSQETLLKLEKRFATSFSDLHLTLTSYLLNQAQLVFGACFEARPHHRFERIPMCMSATIVSLSCCNNSFDKCPTCPDSPTCARLLEEKWRQAYHAVFRFGALSNHM